MIFITLLTLTIATLIGHSNGNNCSHNLAITIQFDQYPEEISWELILVDSSINDTSYSIITRNGDNFESFDRYIESDICLFDGCYSFNLYDTFGNGMFDYEEDIGWFTLSLNNQTMTIDKQAFHGSEMMFYFCTDLFISDDNSSNWLTFNIFQYDLKIRISNMTTTGTNTTDDEEAYALLLENDFEYPHFYLYSSSGATARNTITIVDGCYAISIDNSEILSKNGNFSIQFWYDYLYRTNGTNMNAGKTVSIDFCTYNVIETVESLIVFDVDEAIEEALLAGNDTYSHRVYSTQTIGCESAACSIIAGWYLNGSCDNGKLSIKVIETDFDWSSEYVDIYINDDYIGICEGLDEQCTCGLEQCRNVKFYDVSDYINNNSSFHYTLLQVTLDASREVNYCQ